ncbi:MAG: hypothetical protein IJ545_08345 [Alphaproteobacteria bacterium]|nr:hypothetical protein [Alphaproteobacteria bacterium]
MKRIWYFIQKLYFIIPAILFIMLTAGGFIANCFYSNTFLLDNRPLIQKPDKMTLHFAQDYERYYNDTFAGRKKLVKRYAKLKYKLGLDNGYMIYGQNGWAFYDSSKIPDGYTLIDYYGEVVYTPQELQQIAEGMVAAKEFYAKRGIDYIVVMVPNKESMYSEFMPPRMQEARVSERSRADRAIEYVQQNTDVMVINWRGVLTQAKKETNIPLYFKKDSHWNNLGVYIAYEELARVLQTKGYDLDVPVFERSFIKGVVPVHSDLSAGDDQDLEYIISYKQEQKPLNIENKDNGFFQIWENPTAPIQKRILLIRDSMGLGLMQLMKKDFSYGVYAHNKWNTRKGLKQLIDEYKPDLVIDELSERYFGRFLRYKELYAE